VVKKEKGLGGGKKNPEKNTQQKKTERNQRNKFMESNYSFYRLAAPWCCKAFLFTRILDALTN
jgi:hypothetical protein